MHRLVSSSSSDISIHSTLHPFEGSGLLKIISGRPYHFPWDISPFADFWRPTGLWLTWRLSFLIVVRWCWCNGPIRKYNAQWPVHLSWPILSTNIVLHAPFQVYVSLPCCNCNILKLLVLHSCFWKWWFCVSFTLDFFACCAALSRPWWRLPRFHWCNICL